MYVCVCVCVCIRYKCVQRFDAMRQGLAQITATMRHGTRRGAACKDQRRAEHACVRARAATHDSRLGSSSARLSGGRWPRARPPHGSVPSPPPDLQRRCCFVGAGTVHPLIFSCSRTYLKMFGWLVASRQCYLSCDCSAIFLLWLHLLTLLTAYLGCRPASGRSGRP